MTWVRAVIVGAALLVASWGVLVLLARRPPPGILKDLAGFLPATVTTVRILRPHPEVPRSAKLAVAFAGVWVISPIDLIPEFLPIIGPLDDVVVVAIAPRFAARRVPPRVLFDAGPGDPTWMARLIDRPIPDHRSTNDSDDGVRPYRRG